MEAEDKITLRCWVCGEELNVSLVHEDKEGKFQWVFPCSCHPKKEVTKDDLRLLM